MTKDGLKSIEVDVHCLWVLNNYINHKNRPNNFACLPEINSLIMRFQVFILFSFKVIKGAKDH